MSRGVRQVVVILLLSCVGSVALGCAFSNDVTDDPHMRCDWVPNGVYTVRETVFLVKEYPSGQGLYRPNAPSSKANWEAHKAYYSRHGVVGPLDPGTHLQFTRAFHETNFWTYNSVHPFGVILDGPFARSTVSLMDIARPRFDDARRTGLLVRCVDPRYLRLADSGP